MSFQSHFVISSTSLWNWGASRESWSLPKWHLYTKKTTISKEIITGLLASWPWYQNCMKLFWIPRWLIIFYVLFNELLAAFRKSYSRQTLSIKFIEDIKSALDKGHEIGTVYMDLSKALDCLPHGLLIAKLHAYGLSEAPCETMFDYLQDRKQRVKISNSHRSWKQLTKGVPQSSILGPFLFNVFMNDLFLFMKNCKLYNYADDNSIMYSSPDLFSIILNLKIDCKNAIDWFASNGMKANPSKFQFMMLSNECIQEQYIDIADGITLRSEPCVKVLGVTIDDRLQFNEHVSACCSKAAKQLNAISRISRHISLKSKSIFTTAS